MRRFKLLLPILGCLILSIQAVHNTTNSSSLCSVFDPFRVLPDNNKFQIGGSFPLHEDDCERLRPDTVQEIVAIQWALTHWNQNPSNFNAKLGLYAGDTCSRSRESLSQSLRFLDSVGYHEPKECRSELPGAKLLGIIAPKDYTSSLSLGTLLTVSEVPVMAYSSESVNALVELEAQNLVATTPTIGVYVEALIRLMGALRSNLVTVVDDGSNSEVVKRIVSQLRSSDIFVAEVIPMDHPHLPQALEDSDSDIVVSILTKEQLFNVIRRKVVYDLEKLWVSVPLEGEALDAAEQQTVLNPKSKLELISLQPRTKELPQFRDYFIRVLKNNFQSYQLLTSFVQQVYNCTDDTCNMDKEKMTKKYIQSRTTESVILMTYAFAAVGKAIGGDAIKERICSHPSPECTTLIMNELIKLDYEFGINDPPELAGERLRFYRGREQVLLAHGMTVDAIEVFIGPDGKSNVYQLLTYTTGSQPTVVVSSIRPADQRLRSICSPYRPFCGQCPTVQTVNSNLQRHYLSIPKHYPLYLFGLFDLHSGNTCNSMVNTDISLPMAFIHTVWTFKQRFPQLSLLKNLDFGALLVDSCASGRKSIESVVRAESQCFRFNQAGRNITIVPGSISGYISGLRGESEQALLGFFSSTETQVPFVSVTAEPSDDRRIFTSTPSGRSQAIALLRLLNRMQWQFVTVALSEQDPESLAAFRHFERLALDRGVCLAEVVNIGGTRVDNLPISTNTNVTVVFATARDAAAYLSLTLRSSHRSVHIMMGDAHDWYLHEDTNREAFLGTLSVQPKDILYGDFREWIETTTPLTLPEMWFWDFIEEKWQCALTQKSKVVYGRMCTGDEVLDVGRLGRMTKSGYLARGIERFLFAMDSVYKKLCPLQQGVCLDFFENGRRQTLELLMKTAVEDDIEIYEYLPLSKPGEFDYVPFGNWSLTSGLRMRAVYQAFPSGQPTPVSHCHPPMCKCFLDGDFLQRPLDNFVSSEEPYERIGSGSYVRKQPAFGTESSVAYATVFEHLSSGEWRNYPHNFIMLAVVTAMTIVTVAVLVLVLIKLYLRVVKGNQSLGISLLVGILLLYVTAYFFIFDPTDTVCRFRVILHGIGYTICFGVMIAKATQLRNAETLGFGTTVHISFWNYWLLLFFIIGVQIALSTRWMAEPFMSTIAGLGDHQRMQCSLSDEEFVLSNIYVVILLFLALFLNSQNRNIKRNYKETKWLFVSSIICIIIWSVWIVSYFIAPFEYKQLTVICQLLSCATVLLGFLFGPKIYILLSYEPVVVEYKPENMSNINALNLFEKDEDVYSQRAVSPASSTDSSHRSAGGSLNGRQATPSNASTFSDDQSPIFHTVMRKKAKVRRSQSEHELQHNQMRMLAGVPVIRSASSKKDAMHSPPYTNRY
ncbi:unnamed protein product [Auanema sp. JU1783]|nr:unnamed protein product [Auanema sp. JU1783]